MKLRARTPVLIGFLALGFSAAAQMATINLPTTSESAQVPRLIRFSGIAKDETGKPMSGVLGMTFALYKDEQGGAPLWVETQNVRADTAGHYTVLLGSASADGIPLSLFSSAEAHWISTQISGQPESGHVLLLSVPYALKAADAETLGGLPASAFVQTNPAETSGSATSAKPAHSNSSGNSLAITGSGTTDYVPLWTSGSALGNSILYQSGGNVGVGTKTPGATLDTVSTAIAVRGTSSGATGTGVFGKATSTTGVNFGVQGTSASPKGGGVLGTGPNGGVSGVATATTGVATGVYGQVSSPEGNGVAGFALAKSGTSSGVFGQTASTTDGATAVYGNSTGASGITFGVQGAVVSAAGVGVQGVNNSTAGGNGVAGFANATKGSSTGVYGQSGSTTAGASGVSGFEAATTGAVFGVSGSTNSTTSGAAGINGYEGATTGEVYGVNGSTPSTSGTGVIGVASATSGSTNGVVGLASGTTGLNFGVQGITASSAGIGVQGSNKSTGGAVALAGSPLLINAFVNKTGVFNVDNSGNGFFAGNLNVTGTLTKGSGSFKIDDPLDPANKYLSHSFVESPDMMNVYNGNITTDGHGVATVILPDYFEALNRDFRYQLTVIGQFAQAIVKQEIVNNRFTIKTSKPSVKVSWQVTGIRHDAYANAHRIPVEEAKAPQEQGHYLHPELFGGSEEQAIGALPFTSLTPLDSSTRASLMSLAQAAKPQ
jgi:trimeric autotransporter adhesin